MRTASAEMGAQVALDSSGDVAGMGGSITAGATLPSRSRGGKCPGQRSGGARASRRPRRQLDGVCSWSSPPRRGESVKAATTAEARITPPATYSETLRPWWNAR